MKYATLSKLNPLTCLKVILACIFPSTSSMDGLSPQTNSFSERIAVMVKSSLNPSLITWCSISTKSFNGSSKTQIISALPVETLGRVHFVS